MSGPCSSIFHSKLFNYRRVSIDKTQLSYHKSAIKPDKSMQISYTFHRCLASSMHLQSTQRCHGSKHALSSLSRLEPASALSVHGNIVGKTKAREPGKLEFQWTQKMGWVKTLYPFCSHQNSWDLWMFIP